MSNIIPRIKRFLLGLLACAAGITASPVQAMEKDGNYQGYLFVYFEGRGPKESQEQLRFAYSADAKNWYALNNNQPVLRSKDISQTGGIRDPHILRRADNKGFYMVATDMYTMKNGWGHNPGIVMLKSDNLTDWSHSIIVDGCYLFIQHQQRDAVPSGSFPRPDSLLA